MTSLKYVLNVNEVFLWCLMLSFCCLIMVFLIVNISGLCFPNPCQHEGYCTDETFFFKCQCAEGYTGNTCETNIDECDSRPCKHNGTCFDGVNSYSCQCKSGYYGSDCENVNQCVSNPCSNDGTCSNNVGSDGLAFYVCTCAPGYTGQNCEIYDPCHQIQCNDDGFCTGENCICLGGYNGYYCHNTGNFYRPRT